MQKHNVGPTLLALATLTPFVAQASTFRVCWQAATSPITQCGEALSEHAANAFVSASDSPKVAYWVEKTPAEIDWRTPRRIGVGVGLAAGVFDAWTTTQGFARGASEANPAFGPHPGAARLYGMNVGLVVGPALLAEWFTRRHPSAAHSVDRSGFFGEMGASALHIALGLHNQSVLARQSAK